jgi:MarR family 2-MHQ and catechol resistance regulon transcriptional repressor
LGELICQIWVMRLVKKGLVVRKDQPADRRVRRVELTAKGRTLIAVTFREHAVAMEKVVSVLSTKERTILVRFLKKLGKHAATDHNQKQRKPA